MSQRVLIVDDDSEFSDIVAARCRTLGVRAETATNPLTALTIIDQRRPDLICLDIQMPSGNGLSLCEHLVSDPQTASIPKVVLSGLRSKDVVARCHELQASYVPKCPDFWQTLGPLIAEKLQRDDDARPSSERADPVIVIADDDRDLVDLLARRCRLLGVEVETAYESISALKKIDRRHPDVAILDVTMPSGSGLSVTEMMATNQRLADIPVIMLTGKQDPETIRRCHDLRAYYVAKCTDVWSRLEPLLCEILELPAPAVMTA